MSPRHPGDAGFETRAIHAGQQPDPVTGAVVPPISLATTFSQDAVGDHQGYEYARTANPTRTALETCVAALEDGAHGLAFASGMAAEDAVLRALLRPGDHVLLPNDAYGGTFRLVSRVLAETGVEWSAVDLTDPTVVGAACRDSTTVVWIPELGYWPFANEGNNHLRADVPALVVGDCGGALDSGQVIDAAGASYHRFLLTLVHAMGFPEVTRFGRDGDAPLAQMLRG